MTSHTHHQPSRRTIAKGAAWTLPVVALAASAPAANASPTAVTCAAEVTGSGVKEVHGKKVVLTFTVVNSGSASVSVALMSISGPANATWTLPAESAWTAPVGTSTHDITLSRSNNATGDASVTAQVCGGPVTLTVHIGT